MGRKLTVEEVCSRLDITRGHWNQLVYRREAPARIVVSPRKFLVDEEVLEQWLDERQERAPAKAVA